MDISGLNMATYATNYAQSKLVNEVGTAVLSKALDNQQAEAGGLLKMMDAAAMELSVNPHIGGNFDMSV